HLRLTVKTLDGEQRQHQRRLHLLDGDVGMELVAINGRGHALLLCDKREGLSSNYTVRARVDGLLRQIVAKSRPLEAFADAADSGDSCGAGNAEDACDVGDGVRLQQLGDDPQFLGKLFKYLVEVVGEIHLLLSATRLVPAVGLQHLDRQGGG